MIKTLFFISHTQIKKKNKKKCLRHYSISFCEYLFVSHGFKSNKFNKLTFTLLSYLVSLACSWSCFFFSRGRALDSLFKKGGGHFLIFCILLLVPNFSNPINVKYMLLHTPFFKEQLFFLLNLNTALQMF